MNRIFNQIMITTEKRSCTTIYSFSATIPPQSTVIGITLKIIHSELLNTIPCRKCCILYVTKQNTNKYSQTMLEVFISSLNTSIKVQTGGLKIFQNSRIHLKILSTRRLTKSKFHTKVKVKQPCYRPSVAQRVGRGIAPLFHDYCTTRK
jgi:hypothetical protein